MNNHPADQDNIMAALAPDSGHEQLARETVNNV